MENNTFLLLFHFITKINSIYFLNILKMKKWTIPDVRDISGTKIKKKDIQIYTYI